MSEFLEGTVTKFNVERGFGFIKPNNGGKDVFCHHSNILMNGFRYLEVNDKVRYQLDKESNGRTKAINVQII